MAPLSFLSKAMLALSVAAPVLAVPTTPKLIAPSPFVGLKRDKATLLKFKSTVTDNANQIANWTASGDVCKFAGVTCDIEPVHNNTALAAINLNGFNLTGFGHDLSLVGFLETFLDLAVFHANTNGFKGTLPKDLTHLPFLYELDLSNNLLTGNFPKALFATNLTYIDLRFNRFTGPLPTEIFEKDLDVLFLNNNQFSGTIPANIGDSTAVYLSVAFNKLTGTIPASAAHFKGKLLEIDFRGNQLTGGVPEGLCGKKGIQLIEVSGNKLNVPLGPLCQKALKDKILVIDGNPIAVASKPAPPKPSATIKPAAHKPAPKKPATTPSPKPAAHKPAPKKPAATPSPKPKAPPKSLTMRSVYEERGFKDYAEHARKEEF